MLAQRKYFVNQNTKKHLKTLQEQYDEYLIDLDPKTTNATIGHTKAPFPDENEITNTSDQLVSQKSFVPDEAKQVSKIKQNDNLLINKQIDEKEKVYSNSEYNKNIQNKENEEILNIGESKENHLDDLEEEFKSKAQAKYFYSQANKPGKTGKKWKKMADEFSSKTDYNKLPDHIKESNNLNNLIKLLLK